MMSSTWTMLATTGFFSSGPALSRGESLPPPLSTNNNNQFIDDHSNNKLESKPAPTAFMPMVKSALDGQSLMTIVRHVPMDKHTGRAM